MTDLVLAVTLLQYGVAQLTAERIASEPQLARPLADSDEELNALLPAQFFNLQHQLREHARAVARAAAAHDDAALAESFGRMTTDCVGCHSAYLYRPGAP
jgi:hypothetical protein